jgi:membrane protease YdiL (CAAX protease family)
MLVPLRQHPLVSFFVLAYAWTWLCWWPVAAAGGQWELGIRKEWLTTLGQFGPFAAGLAVAFATGGGQGVRELLGRLVRWRARPVWVGVSLLLLPAAMLAAIFLFSLWHGRLGALHFRDRWSTLPAHFVYLMILGGPLGEEPGWRGFALPRLQAALGPLRASIWLGVLGAGWHLPLWWLYPPPSPFWMFVLGAVLLSFLFTWLLQHTGGSALYSVIFHTSLSLGSVRLPEVPAYHVWLVCLALVVIPILVFDRSFRRSPDAQHADTASRQLPCEVDTPKMS